MLQHNAASSAPSGIAQLRKIVGPDAYKCAASREPRCDEPRRLHILGQYLYARWNWKCPLRQSCSKKETEKSSNAVASAIPIKMRKESTAQFAVPQSVPVPHHNPRSNEEFQLCAKDIFERRRIDERRVSYYFFEVLFNLAF